MSRALVRVPCESTKEKIKFRLVALKNKLIKEDSSKGGRRTHARTCACPKPSSASSSSSSISSSRSWTPSGFSSQPRASS